MYQIGENVVYGIHGVCVVADQEERIIDRKKRIYLALEPIGQEGSRFLVPTHNETAMSKLRPMLTAQELQTLIQSEQVHADCWIKDENQRKQVYRELISSGDRIRLMQMVATLYRHKAAQMAANRKVHLCDDNFLRDAEKLLIGEFAIVLDIQPEEARSYIRQYLKKVE